MIESVHNALNQEECKQLILMSLNSMRVARTFGGKSGSRIATVAKIYKQNDLTKKVQEIVKQKSGLSVKNQEPINIVNYKIGGEYKKHFDAFDSHFEDVLMNGGNRAFTALFYLNDNFAGGETEFVNINGLKIKPETGKLILWKNLNDDGTLDKNSLHAGLPVTNGEKWILIIWVRESKLIKYYI